MALTSLLQNENVTEFMEFLTSAALKFIHNDDSYELDISGDSSIPFILNYPLVISGIAVLVLFMRNKIKFNA